MERVEFGEFKGVCKCGKPMALKTKKRRLGILYRYYECSHCGWSTTSWERKG